MLNQWQKALKPHWDTVLLIVCAATLLVTALSAQISTPSRFQQSQTPSRITALLSLNANASSTLAPSQPPPKATQSRGHSKTKPFTAKKPPQPIHLNHASVSQLQVVPGIGPKLAQRITTNRQQHGPFINVQQLTRVKGIGPKRIEKLKPYLRL